MNSRTAKPIAICLMGPTASGKSDLALELAASHPFEIVSVDSAMIYRGMDIGTAKPPADVLDAYPHHLIDILDPTQAYSAAEFRRDALALIEDICARGKIPLLIGGTMLYFRALTRGLSELPSADPVVREKIAAIAAEQGWPAVHARLAEVDPQAARRIHPNDPQRLQRAMEIYELSGRAMSDLHSDPGQACPYTLCQIAVVPEDRTELHRLIERRFIAMLEAGLLEEVTRLRDRGDLTPDLPSMKAVGYRQVWAHLQGEYGYDEMVSKGVAATRQLAKRQLTWLRSWPDVHRIGHAEALPVLKILRSGSILG